jgi:hypothetical protein
MTTLFDVGGDGDAGDGKADRLTLTAAEAANWVAHEEEALHVVGAETGATEGLTGAELALDGDALAVVDIAGGVSAVGRAGALGAALGACVGALIAHGEVALLTEIVLIV